MTQEGLRSVQHHFHGVNKTMNHLQGLGYGHTGLFLSKSASFRRTASISLSPKSFFVNVTATYSRACYSIGYDSLTETALHDILRSKSQHGEHYLYSHIRYRRSRWDLRIDIEAFEENS